LFKIFILRRCVTPGCPASVDTTPYLAMSHTALLQITADTVGYSLLNPITYSLGPTVFRGAESSRGILIFPRNFAEVEKWLAITTIFDLMT